MIGRIPEQKFSFPLESTKTIDAVVPGHDSSVHDPEDRPNPLSLGVANAQDGFEKAQQDDLLEKLGLGKKGIVDPVGYPGEEWLWQESQN